MSEQENPQVCMHKPLYRASRVIPLQDFAVYKKAVLTDREFFLRGLLNLAWLGIVKERLGFRTRENIPV